VSAFASVRGVSSAQESGGNIVIPKPTGTLDDDILVIFWCEGPGGLANTAVAAADIEAEDFELVYGSGGVHYVSQKVAASEPASWTFPVTGTRELAAHCVAFVPGTLAYNESYPNVTGPGWVQLSSGVGQTIDHMPSPWGYTTTGETADTSTSDYQDIVAVVATARRVTAGGTPVADTIDTYTTDGDAVAGTEQLLPTVDWGGGFKQSFRWGKLGHITDPTGGLQLTVAFSGGSGTLADEPSLAYQAFTTIDPDAVFPSDNESGPELTLRLRKLEGDDLPHQISAGTLSLQGPGRGRQRT
jgi:hypothetical protein